MGISKKINGCQFYIQPEIPTEKNFNLPAGADAAYVVGSDKLFYVEKLAIKQSETGKLAAKINIIKIKGANVSEIISGIKYTDNFKENPSAMLTASQLSVISANSGHIHQQNEVKQLVQCFKKIMKVHEFSVQHRALYSEAIKNLEVFVEFCSKNKFGNELKMSLLLTKEDAEVIVNGYEQLKRLMPSKDSKFKWGSMPNDITALYDKICEFDDKFREATSSCGKLIGKINGIEDVIVKADKGTSKQQILIANLKSECVKYRKHLNIEMGREPGNSTPIDKNEDPSLAAKKFNKVQGLIAVLDNNTNTATARITGFTTAYKDCEKEFKEHRDGSFKQFLKGVGFVLSSICLGAGLFYSKLRKGTFDFTKSHGAVLAEKIQSELDDDNYKDSEFVKMY